MKMLHIGDRPERTRITRYTLLASIAVAIYFSLPSIALRYYLPEIIFKKSNNIASSEDALYKVSASNNEALIRQYGKPNNKQCAIFFPGRHGGILRYEKEIFEKLKRNGITVFSISYPGYEGATGNADFSSIPITINLALKKIEQQTSCIVGDAVYIGRSLGASVALETAKHIRPKGMVLDSLPLSLAKSIRTKLRDHIITAPLTLLPIEKLVGFDVSTKKALADLGEIPIVVFQGAQDKVTPLEDIEELLNGYDNISLNIIGTASHHDTYVLAGDKYFDAIRRLLAQCRSIRDVGPIKRSGSGNGVTSWQRPRRFRYA